MQYKTHIKNTITANRSRRRRRGTQLSRRNIRRQTQITTNLITRRRTRRTNEYSKKQRTIIRTTT